MSIEGLLIFLLIGALAGWAAGTLMKGGSFGLVGNIIVGVVGAFIGGFLFPRVGLSIEGYLGLFVSATLGACLLLLLLRYLPLSR